MTMVSPALPAFPPLDPQSVDPRRGVFLGRDTADLRRCWSGESDSIGIIGPPRYGKSSGLFVPTLLHWDGPAVVTSTRGDLLSATGRWRQQVAGGHGGQVLVYDPFGSVPGVRSARWSPLAGCSDPSVCYGRVAAMTAATGRGVEDSDHWRAGAARILRGYFHAAALDGRPLRDVRRWLARQDVAQAADILETHDTAASFWADDLLAVAALGDRERGSMYSLATDSLEATADPAVLASAGGTDLDVDAFLRSSSTLYIVGPSHRQAVAAPLVVGLVDSIAQRAAELAELSGGRLDPPLLLALDEVANIAPLESLPQLVSEGGGRGTVTMWAAQSLAQVRARWGTDLQQAILTATTCKIIFGGMSNGHDLADVSGWAGEYREASITTTGRQIAQDRLGVGRLGGTVGALTDQGGAGGDYSVTGQYRPALPPDAIQQLPPHYAWLWHRSDPPLLVETRPAGLVPTYAQLAGRPIAPDGAA